MTTVTLSTEAIQVVVQDYFAATRSMDGEAWVATFAPDGVCYDALRLMTRARFKLSKAIGIRWQ
ncbi:MAG: hypothetical protein ACP5RH_10685 [Leptodesmis sp.]|uniref:hypothetical protein n=1 Tax=Leptodesmis sp. TaxID=3100501 RepID=UPI003D0CD1E8